MRYKFFCTLLCSLFIVNSLYSQKNQIVPLNNSVYTYIKNLQERGYLADLNPTRLPYTRGQIHAALQAVDIEHLSETERFWYSFIENENKIKTESESEEGYYQAQLEGGFDMNNTLSPNTIRPQVNTLFFLPNGALTLYGEREDIGAQMGLSHDLFYDRDKIGESSLSRYFIRTEDYYLGYQNDFLNLYFGRYQHHWGPYQQASTILSTNSNSFDNLNITIGNSWFKASGVFGELDNLGKDGTFDRRGGSNLKGGVRRFLALHRVDIKVTDNLKLGYFDAMLYSSENSLPSFEYINPLNVLFFERNTNPVNDEFNAMFGGLIWWKASKMTMNLQVMIDDIVINSDSGVEEPATFAVTHSVNFSGITDKIDLGYEAELVAYQTYNTDQAEGRYLYLKRGIANQFTDYVYITAYMNYYAYSALPGLRIKPSLSFLAQGEQDINQDFVREYPNGELIDIILTGVEEKTSRVALDVFYNPNPRFWIDASLGYNYLENKDHISGNSDSRITARIEAGFRIFFDSNSGSFPDFLDSVF